MSDEPSTQQLAIDPTRCDGVGICAIQAPDLIELDVWGFPVMSDEPLDARRLKQAARAVSACPKKALFLQPTNA